MSEKGKCALQIRLFVSIRRIRMVRLGWIPDANMSGNIIAQNCSSAVARLSCALECLESQPQDPEWTSGLMG